MRCLVLWSQQTLGGCFEEPFYRQITRLAAPESIRRLENLWKGKVI